MPFYLETLDGSLSFKADVFMVCCSGTVKTLEHGKIYTPEELGFVEWLKRSPSCVNKAPIKKLRAVFYG